MCAIRCVSQCWAAFGSVKANYFNIGTGRVIKGCDIGMMGMCIGGKRKLFMPAQLA